MGDFFQAVAFLFNTGWIFMTSFNLPGVNFTPLAALFFVAFFVVVWKFLRSVVGRIVGSNYRSGRGVSSPPSKK